eukprot:5954998-Pleurochrysis_carterae.AAC.1
MGGTASVARTASPPSDARVENGAAGAHADASTLAVSAPKQDGARVEGRPADGGPNVPPVESSCTCTAQGREATGSATVQTLVDIPAAEGADDDYERDTSAPAE